MQTGKIDQPLFRPRCSQKVSEVTFDLLKLIKSQKILSSPFKYENKISRKMLQTFNQRHALFDSLSSLETFLGNHPLMAYQKTNPILPLQSVQSKKIFFNVKTGKFKRSGNFRMRRFIFSFWNFLTFTHCAFFGTLIILEDLVILLNWVWKMKFNEIKGTSNLKSLKMLWLHCAGSRLYRIKFKFQNALAASLNWPHQFWICTAICTPFWPEKQS